MPAASAPVLGSSPAGRSSTTIPSQRGGVRSTVLPFRTARRSSESYPDQANSSSSSFQRQSFEMSTLPARRISGFDQRPVGSPGRSAPVGSQGLRRPDVLPQQRAVGFEPAPDNAGRPPMSPQQPSRGGSLLTRQLSQDVCSTSVSQQKLPQTTELQRTLEKCLQQSPAQPAGEAAPDSHAAQPEQLQQLQARHPVFAAPVVGRAFGIAAAVASAERLESNSRTALILADLGLDADAVAAALLHDALDTSPLTRAQLELLVPQPVADTVGNVSRITGACQLLRADSSAEEADTAAKLANMFLAMADVPAVLIMLASRLQRLRSVAAQAAAGGADLRAEAQEGLAVFAPLANRLGVWSLKAELEDLCFLVLHPTRAKELRDVLAEPQSRSGLAAALGQLKGSLDATGLSYQDLSGRPKNLYSVHSKLARKAGGAGAGAGPADVSQIYDVRAVRLIVGSKSDCYAALRAVELLWTPLPARFKDYIRNPKANGYQSLHTVVIGPDGLPMEVQIRTAKMHYIAEYGIAAHWRYKEALPDQSAHIERLTGWARWLITWKLELEDGKTRPRGSPPRDTSLAGLFGGRGATAQAAAASGSAPASHPHDVAAGNGASCTFPEHAPECRFAQYVHSERFAPRAAPDHLSSPVYIVLMNATSAKDGGPAAAGEAAEAAQRSSLVRSLSNALDPLAAPTVPQQPQPCIQEVPAGTSVAAILAGGVPGLGGSAGAAGKLRVLVNHEVVADPQAALRHGDKVEIFDAEPVAAPASPAPRGNVVPFRRKASADAAAPAAGSLLQQPRNPSTGAAAATPPLAARPSAPAGSSPFEAVAASSPADETPDERRRRHARQRQMLDRAFSRELSQPLEHLSAASLKFKPRGEVIAS